MATKLTISHSEWGSIIINFICKLCKAGPAEICQTPPPPPQTPTFPSNLPLPSPPTCVQQRKRQRIENPLDQLFNINWIDFAFDEIEIEIEPDIPTPTCSTVDSACNPSPPSSFPLNHSPPLPPPINNPVIDILDLSPPQTLITFLLTLDLLNA